MKTMSNVEDVLKVRVRKRLLCTGGPREGYPAGIVYEAPFPPGILRELQMDRKRIESGLGSLEIVQLMVDQKPAGKTKPVDKIVPVEEVDGGEPGESDELAAMTKIAAPSAVDAVIDPVVDALVDVLVEGPEDAPVDALPEGGEAKDEPVDPEPPYVRPVCLDGDAEYSLDANADRRAIRTYAQERFGVKIDWRLSLEKMIEQVRLLEAGI